jgi:hypothetical protein
MSDQKYSEPVAQLLTLGEPEDFTSLEYETLGIHAEHIPDLIRLVEDHALHWESAKDDPAVYAQVHAWRALGQLKAATAVPALLGLLGDVETDLEWDDWVSVELPEVFGMLGPTIMPTLADYMVKPVKENFWGAVTAANGLVKIAQLYPEARLECIQALSRLLENYPENDAELNGLIISDLADLDALEAAPLVERAFASGNVDESIMGDWEEYQVDVGLLAKRITPRPRFGIPFSSSAGSAFFGRSIHTEDKKTKNKRKQEKQSRKKNRKKKK